MSDKLVNAAGKSIIFNVGAQLFIKLLTFGLNAVSLKFLPSNSIIGIINVRLALLHTTLQFLSREPFRLACLGAATKKTDQSWKRTVNTIWLGFVVSIILSAALTRLWFAITPPVDDLTGTTESDFQYAVIIICLSVITEMVTESCYIYCQANSLTSHNPKVETISVGCKCSLQSLVIILYGLFASNPPGSASNLLTKIALCQLLSSVISVTYSYTKLYLDEGLGFETFLPRFSGPLNTMFDTDCIKLCSVLFFQSLLKQVLTEGERYLMTFLNVISLGDQGIYDVINNLASLPARILFRPIEQSSHTLFSQIIDRNKKLNSRACNQVQNSLLIMMKVMTILGLILLVFGQNFVYTIVFYGREKLNNVQAFRLMQWQLFYLPLLAINGITECFTFAAMNQRELTNHSFYLILSSITFVVCVYMSSGFFGSASFILANCIVMAFRIAYSFLTIKGYFSRQGYRVSFNNVLPSLTTLISLSGVFVFLQILKQMLKVDHENTIALLIHLFSGSVSLIFILHVLLCHEIEVVDFLEKLFKPQDKGVTKARDCETKKVK